MCTSESNCLNACCSAGSTVLEVQPAAVELAQERVDRQLERSQDAHLIKAQRKALREVRYIVRASLAASRGDPPSVTGQHCAAKKRARFDAQGARNSRLPDLGLMD